MTTFISPATQVTRSPASASARRLRALIAPLLETRLQTLARERWPRRVLIVGAAAPDNAERRGLPEHLVWAEFADRREPSAVALGSAHPLARAPLYELIEWSGPDVPLRRTRWRFTPKSGWCCCGESRER